MKIGHKKILLATNPAFWPSVGGSERVLERILLGVKDMFDEVVVFTESVDKKTKHNGITILPYNPETLLEYAQKYRPAIYFPNMVHSRITFKNIDRISPLCQKTVVNLIGGYPPDAPLAPRVSHLKKVEKHADFAVHVDALSTEFFIDRTINPRVKYAFVSQGLNFDELEPYRKLVGETKNSYFLYAHNLWSWKKPDLYVEEIAARLPELDFKVLANDKTGDFIEQTLAHAKKYKNVSVELGLNRADYLKILAGATALVSTSSIEGAQPNIMLEAGYLGVPYLTLSPGQNYGHYPHVEMYYSLDELRDRIDSGGYGILKDKAGELNRAKAMLSSGRFDWNEIIKEYRGLFWTET